ncbi:MAG: hypothetical protein ACLQNE_24905 [Thermoguttaceae bacterium]
MNEWTRRRFLAGTTAAAVTTITGKLAPAVEQKTNTRDWSKVRGFNYQPSYGSSGFELWQKFDAVVIDRELGLGKKYFPGMNAIRLWLSWDSFLRNPKRFAGNFNQALGIAEKYGLVVMPVLFNRWHDAVLDYGGIYIDHFLPKVSWVQKPAIFDPYMEAIVGGHKDDPRILAWDLSNEPYSYSCPREDIPQVVQAETAWLQGLYDKCKVLGAKAPVTVGIHPGVPLEMVDKMSDLLSIHPYWVHNSPGARKEDYEKKLDAETAYAKRVRKPILATECCWGSLDDKVRVESIRYTLTQLQKRGIGWLAYLLHHSLIADAHRPEFGPVGFPGYLGFIEADGSLRTGHDVFNDF